MDTVLMENSVTRLGLAVSLTDDFTGKQPVGDVGLSLGAQQALENPSGFYLFMDVAPGAYHLATQTSSYFDQQVDVTLPLPAPPVVAVTLKPLPSYPFPANATLVRGLVRQGDGTPIPGATASIVGREVDGQSTDKGEFVLYFKGLTQADIIKVDGKRYVRRDGSKKLQLQVTCPGFKKKTVQIEVEEKDTTSVVITLTKGG